jgi:ribosome maturation factor RimP
MGLFFFTDRFEFRHFNKMTTPLREQLITLIEPLLGQLGYELVDLEYAPGRTHAVVRVFIDQPQGVGLDDCERVSHELSALLDVEDPVPTAYTLEVSSPGVDRVLRTRAHFQRFVGERVWVELRTARDGRRRYTGRLEALDEQGIELVVDGAMVRVPFGEIGRARLAPQWSSGLQEL